MKQKFDELLEHRKQIKSKKPTFLKQDAHKIKRLKSNWRQPRGIHSKMRLKLRSYRKQPSIGFSSPKIVRNLTPSGHKIILVNNVSDLENINDPITIASGVGLLKRIAIVKKAKEKNMTILNIKDLDKFIQETEAKLKKKKEAKKKKQTAKDKKKEERLEKAEEKKKKEEKKTEEEKQEEKIKTEKQEKKKVLEQG